MIFLAFDFEGRTNSTAWEVLAILTLPWSIVSVLFLWAISHGSGLESFAIMYGVFGLVNARLIYLVFRTLKFRNKDVENIDIRPEQSSSESDADTQ